MLLSYWLDRQSQWVEKEALVIHEIKLDRSRAGVVVFIYLGISPYLIGWYADADDLDPNQFACKLRVCQSRPSGTWHRWKRRTFAD
jgi:hypothetical protein